MDARNAMKQKPIETSRTSERMKKFEIANSPRKIPYPNTNAQTQNGLGWRLLKEASHRPAAMAPIPGPDWMAFVEQPVAEEHSTRLHGQTMRVVPVVEDPGQQVAEGDGRIPLCAGLDRRMGTVIQEAIRQKPHRPDEFPQCRGRVRASWYGLERVVAACERSLAIKAARANALLRRKADPIFGKACKFLDPVARRCTVYEGRPAVCREFPARARCAYHDLLVFERSQQGDDTVLPLVQITFRNGNK